MKKVCIGCLVFFLIVTISWVERTSIIRAEATSNTQDAGKVLIATGEWPPVVSESLEGYGPYIKVLTAVFKEMRIEPDYKFYPWTRCELVVEQGKAFAAYPYAFTEERARRFLYSIAILHGSPTKLFYYKKNKADFIFEELKDLQAYKVAGVRGYSYLDKFEKAGIQPVLMNNEEDAVRMLVLGRVELAPFQVKNGWQLIKNLFPDEEQNFGILNKSAFEEETHLIVSKTYPNSRELLTIFNTTLQNMIEQGMYQKLIEENGLEEYSVAGKK
jgi:polar amino acid transport system substrate-binding protein